MLSNYHQSSIIWLNSVTIFSKEEVRVIAFRKIIMRTALENLRLFKTLIFVYGLSDAEYNDVMCVYHHYTAVDSDQRPII